MTSVGPQPSDEYLETLLAYYEEEISGEAYFEALADHFDEREKVLLLARVERYAADSVVPLIEKYGLIPRDTADIQREGRGYRSLHQSLSWSEFMSYMVRRYPEYLVEFRSLEQMAPAEDLPALKVLTGHEVAVIEFAKMELAGDADSLKALLDYMA